MIDALIDTLEVIFIVLGILKIFGLIEISWALVFVPLLIALTFAMITVIVLSFSEEEDTLTSREKPHGE